MVDLFQVNCEEIALEQGKTIKEIAEELGVSKTAVRKQIANLGLQTSLRKIGNQFAIEKEQETLIKSAFSQKQSQTNRKPSFRFRKPIGNQFAIGFHAPT